MHFLNFKSICIYFSYCICVHSILYVLGNVTEATQAMQLNESHSKHFRVHVLVLQHFIRSELFHTITS